MILENFTPNFGNEDVVLEASADFVGDASELAELTVGAFSEMHNLTIALARLEHKCLVESGNEALLEVGIKEFFVNAGKSIAEYFRKFIAWLGSLYTKMKDVFIKREDWLKRNSSVINGITDDQLKDVKVSIGKNLLSSDFHGAVNTAVSQSDQLLKGVQAIQGPEQQKSFKDKALEMLKKPLKSRDDKKSMAADIHTNLIGESEELPLTKSMVASLEKVALSTFRAADAIKGAKTAAEGAIRYAEGIAKAEEANKEAVNARIAAIRDVGHQVQAAVAGYASAIGAANGMAMPILVKVAGIAGKGKKKEEPAAAGAAPAAAKTEDTSVLAAFM